MTKVIFYTGKLFFGAILGMAIVAILHFAMAVASGNYNVEITTIEIMLGSMLGYCHIGTCKYNTEEVK